MPPVFAAAYAALVSALPAAPFVGATVVALGIVATHTPGPDTVQILLAKPEPAAECMKRNIEQNSRLVAMVQPLQGTEVIGIILKRGGSTGDPVMDVVIHETGAGSRAEFRPLTASDQQPDVIGRMIAGC